MTTSTHAQADFTAEDQILELTEDQLEAVEGGALPLWALIPPLGHAIYEIHRATTR